MSMNALADIILNHLQTKGDWMTRAEIARAIRRGNGILNPHDLDVVWQLFREGRIELQQEETGVAKWRYRYRAVK